MVRVRANAKLINSPSPSLEIPNPPPLTTEIRGGEISNPPPPPREIEGEESPNPPHQREIVDGGTRNPLSPRDSESAVKRRKTEGQTLNPLPQEETGGGEISNREIVGREPSNSPSPSLSPREITGRNEIRATIDPDSLECDICFYPLCPPIYRCINGHVACSSCWEQLQYICPTCNKPRGPQNMALEKMLESIHLPCPHANFGCHQSLSYSEMQVHTETCEFGPSQEETGGGGGGGGEEDTTGRNEIRVTIDPESLKCSICTNPLFPPLYQCINDHLACYSCDENVQINCPTCDKPIGTQNIALEKMLESIHLPCPQANFGCCQFLPYSQMQVHYKRCDFIPSLCPIPGCAHKAISGEWQAHFLKAHGEPTICYHYGHSHEIKLIEDNHYYTLLGPGKDMFLLVMKPIPNFGNVISLFYDVDLADLRRYHLSYELVEENPTTGGSFKSQAVSIKEWKRGGGRHFSLLVPSFVSLPRYRVHVLINKNMGRGYMF